METIDYDKTKELLKGLGVLSKKIYDETRKRLKQAQIDHIMFGTEIEDDLFRKFNGSLVLSEFFFDMSFQLNCYEASTLINTKPEDKGPKKSLEI